MKITPPLRGLLEKPNEGGIAFVVGTGRDLSAPILQNVNQTLPP